MKRLISIILCCLFLFLAASCLAADSPPATLFEQANVSAVNGQYEKAISLYLQVAHSKGVSASLLYNLANCYAKIDQVGKAVANYERALRIDPGNEDIRANLAQVRKDAGLYRDDSPLYERMASLLQADQWLMLAGGAFFLLSLTQLIARTVTAFTPALARGLTISLLLLILVSLPLAVFRYQSWNDGVVTGPEARLLISPFAEAAATGTIKPGRLIKIKQHHGRYVLVQDATGRNGWLDLDNIIALPDLGKL